MTRPLALCAAIVLAPLAVATAQPEFPEPPRHPISAEDRARVEEAESRLAGRIAELRKSLPADRTGPDEWLADVEVCHKAAEWIARFEEFYTPKYVDMTLRTLAEGLGRAEALAKGEHPWTSAAGSAVRGYRSKVDGSVQPYAIVVPEGHDPKARARLDVVLHGRGATLNEVSFFNAHHGKPAPADAKGLVLHVFGRGNNAYRWAGETDVFEAIEAVRRAYEVDERRVVLRGFSMGGAGAWHLGLHHPSAWCTVEAGAGFTETRNYARQRDLPDYQEKALHIYDAVDYALNAFNLPMVGYGGEEDPQRQASLNVQQALEALGFPMHTEGLVTRAEGIDFLRVVGAKVGHKVDPESAKVLEAFRDERAARGLDPTPKRVRFVTYTLKYNHAFWVTVAELERHYERATVDAEIDGETVVVRGAENVAVLGIDRHVGEEVRIGGRELPLRTAAEGRLPLAYFKKVDGAWEALDFDTSHAIANADDGRKRPGLQGPIDDAFTGSFLCVRGTGTPWDPRVRAWSDARLDRFAREWARWMRGDVRIKDDTDVTDDDMRDHHLILFGDPGSNRLIARLLPGLPVKWTRDAVELAGRREGGDHVPALIAPNPLRADRYVVLNSGHTFGAKEFAGTNAFLFPRLGDYALLRLEDGSERVAASGFFDEGWRAPGGPREPAGE